jgi:hypothetical protein
LWVITSQLVTNEETAQQPDLPPAALMHNISTANQFDFDALEANRSGRLVFSQFVQAGKAIVYNLVFAVSLIILVGAVAIGFPAISSHDYASAFLPCSGAVVMLFVTGWIFTRRSGLGVERYGTGGNFLTFLHRLLLPIDLILWRVSRLEGEVETDQRYTTSGDNTNSDIRRYTYVYRIGEKEFTTNEEGYNVFPDHPQKCRIFYLPLSGVMVNLEVL